MEGEADPFDFYLARDLGMSLAQMNAAMSEREYQQWRGFHVWKNAMDDLERK